MTISASPSFCNYDNTASASTTTAFTINPILDWKRMGYEDHLIEHPNIQNVNSKPRFSNHMNIVD